METLILFGGLAAIVLIALMATFATLAWLRVVPEADQAIVINGTSVEVTLPNPDPSLPEIKITRPKVIVGGGTFILPFFHRPRTVSLEAIQIPVSRTAKDAMPTKDRIPTELEGELTVQVDGKNPEQVWLASQKLGVSKPSEMTAVVQNKTDKQIAAALRTAVFEFTFEDLNAKKEDFENRVHQLLQKDLAQLGISLIAVSLPQVAQGKFSNVSGDLFDAEGARKVAETTEAARTATNKINQQNKIARQEDDLAAREKELQIQFETEKKEADQRREVAVYQANQTRQQTEAVLNETKAEELAQAAQAREIAEAQAAEQEKTIKADIAMKEQVAIRNAEARAAASEANEQAAIREAKAAADRKVADEEAARRKEEAEIAKSKAVEAARIAKEQAIKVADELRQQAIEEAEVARQKAVAEARAEEAAARAAEAQALAKQREAEEQVVTVSETAQADRQRQIVEIKANEDAAKDQIAADRDAYVETKKAEGERDAAKNRAAAAKAIATGQADAQREAAQGAADAKKIEAEAYAADKTIRAEANFAASSKDADARKALAEALLKEGEAKAEARRLEVEAENAVAKELLFRDVAVKALEIAPDVMRELMAPVANVAHDVKVLQVNGLGGGAEGADSTVQTIMGTALGITGALPIVREGIQALVENEDVKQIAQTAAKVGKSAIKEAASGVTEAFPDNGSNGVGTPSFDVHAK